MSRDKDNVIVHSLYGGWHADAQSGAVWIVQSPMTRMRIVQCPAVGECGVRANTWSGSAKHTIRGNGKRNELRYSEVSLAAEHERS